MKIQVIAVMILALSLGIRAEISPTIVRLMQTPANQQSWSAPAGKIFVIQHISYEDPSETNAFCMSPDPGSGDIPFKLEGAAAAGETMTITLEKPLLLPSGWSLCLTPPRIGGTFYAFFGVLADQNELYVSNVDTAAPVIEEVAQTGLALDLDVDMGTARPTGLRVERSIDLKTWEIAEALVAQTSATGKHVTVAVNPSQKQEFVRVASTGPRE